MKYIHLSTILIFILFPVSNICLAEDLQNEGTSEIIEDVEFVKVEPGDRADNYTKTERAFALAYPRTLKKHSILFALDHRTSNSSNLTSAQDLFGLDNGSLKIGLSLRYGILDNLDFGISRLNGTAREVFDSYNFDMKYTILSEKHFYPDLLVSAVYTWFNQENLSDASGFGAQILSGKTLGERFYLTLGLGFHSNSSSSIKETADRNYSIFLPATATLRILPWLSFLFEGSLPFLGYSANNASWATGFKFLTFGHSFSILLSNTEHFSYDGQAAGSDRWGKPIFAFSLTREFLL